MAPLVVLVVVLVAVGIVAVLAIFVVGWLGRHWSRTHGQSGNVFALQMAVFGVVQASLQRFDEATADARWSRVSGAGTPWASADAKARPQAIKHLELIEDHRLRQLSEELLRATHGLLMATDPGEGARLRTRVATLHGQFRLRCTEVVRDHNLRHVGRRR